MKKILLILSVLLINSCITTRPGKDVKVYIGNSKEGIVERKQTDEKISCYDELFEGMFCFTLEDFREFQRKCRGE